MKTALLWCFRHEMRAALAFRDEHADTMKVMIRDVIRLDIEESYEEADEIYAGTYCLGRILKMYEGTDHDVQEVWLQPDYRHRVIETDAGYVLQEEVGKQWTAKGTPQPTEEDAWGILDEKELGL